VLKFEAVFSMDPQEVGWRTFIALAIFICLPNTIVGLYNWALGLHVAPGSATFTQTAYIGAGVRFIPTYTLSWTALFLILSVLAYACIPVFIKTTPTSQNHRPAAQKVNSLQKYLMGSLGLLIFGAIYFVLSVQSVPDNKPLVITNYLFMFSLDVLLAYFLSATEVRTATRRYLFNLFHIEETLALGGISHAANVITLGQLPHSAGTESSVKTNVSPSPRSRVSYIVVSSARSDLEHP
jgi:hypothetical protein